MVSEKTISSFLQIAETLLTGNSLEIPSYTQIVDIEGTLLSEAINTVESKMQTTHHSEIRAIEFAQTELKQKFLYNTHLLTVLEPCTMCSGAIIQARIESVTYFAEQKKIPGISRLSLEYILSSNHFPVIKYIPSPQIEETLKRFFKKLRN